MKKHNHFLRKLTAGLLGFVMTLGVGAAGYATAASETKAEDELAFTINFKENGSSDGTSAKSSIADLIATDSQKYISTINTATKLYPGKTGYGMKCGSSGNAGVFKATLATTYQIDATKVVFKLATANSDSTTITASANSTTKSCSATATLTDYTITFSSATKLTTIGTSSPSTSKKSRYYVQSISVYKAAAAKLPLSISGDSTVYNGKTITLSASSNGSAVTGVTWSSSNTGLATVSSSGVVTGVNGTTSGANVTITAKKDGYEDATKTITVKADTKTLQSISASGAQSTFTKGDSFATTGLVVTGTYSHTNGDGDSQEQITTGITTSPASGTKLNTVGPQTVTVNAGGKSTTYSINVNYAAVESVELDYEEGTLGKGAETTLPGVTIEPANANQGYSWGDPVATEGIVYTYDSSTFELAIDANNAVEGTIQFTATATGDASKTATVTYTVQAAQIAKITGVTASETGAIVAKQYVGDAFNPQGFSFAPSWSEGDHEDVEITADDISWNALVAGSNPTGTYSCADGEFTVTITGVTVVNDTLVSIAFADGCDMTKKSYWVGDSWDFSGLSIVGTMDSGKTAPAIASSNVTFSSNDAVATTTTSITVTAEYDNLTATKEISGIVVNEVTMDSLTVNYTGGQPVLGTDFTFAGSITANMSNNTHPTVNLSDVTIGSVDKFTLNQQTITVTHKTTGATGTFNVTYKTKDITYTTSWTRCTSTTDIVSGQTYILGYEATANSGTIIPMKNTNDSNYMNSGTSSGNNGTITMSSVTATSDYEVQLISSTEVSGAYYIKCGDKYISNKNVKNSCTLETETAKTTSFGITVGSNDVFTFKIAENASYHTLSYNTSSPRFACYGGTMKNLVVYKKVQTASGTADIIKLNAALKSGKTFNEGATISASDFNCSTLDNLNQTKTVTATSVSPTNLVAGENTITVYYNTWSTTVTVNAAEVAHLDHIEVVEGTGTRSFTRGTSFNSSGVKIKAYYSNTDKTEFPDRELTSGFTVTPLTSAQMNVADTYNVSVSYTENGVTKNTTYSVTVTPKVSTIVTIAGNGIEGSNGVYTVSTGVDETLALTLGTDGDETIEFVKGDQNVVTFSEGVLTVNSSTESTETIVVSFKAGSAVATLTVNITADVLESISVSGSLPSRTYYGDTELSINEAVSELTVAGLMTSGNPAEIDQSKVIWKFADETDEITLDSSMDTVSVVARYGNVAPVTYNMSINVTEPVLDYIVASHNSNEYDLVKDGDLNKNNVTVIGYLTNGKQVDNGRNLANDCSFTYDVDDAFYKTGNHTITANYGGKSDTFTINVNAKEYTTTTPDTHTYFYEKVTSAQTDWRGKYLIVYDDSLAFDGSLETLDAVSNTKSVTVTDGKIVTDASGKINNEDISFTIAYKNGSTSVYSLKSASGNYISGTTTSAKASNGMKQSTSDSDYEISFDGTTIQSKSSDQQMVLKYNKASGQERFRFYKSGQESVSLYKFVDKVTPGSTVPSDEKHAIRIGDVVCNKTELIAGQPISASDFTIAVQYDTGNDFVTGLTPSSIDKTTLIEGKSNYKLSFTDDYGNTVEKVVELDVKQAPILDNIEIVTDDGWTGEFTRMDSFNHTGVHVWANFSNDYDSIEVTDDVTFSGYDMNVAGTQTVTATYEGKTATYQIKVNPIETTEISVVIKDSNNDVVNLVDGYYNILPGENYTLTFTTDGDNKTVAISGGSANTTITNNVLSSAATSNETVEFTATCDGAELSIPVKVIAAKAATLSSISTSNTGAEASISSNSGLFTGYVGNSVSFDIDLLNFINPVVSEKSSIEGLSLSGSIINDVYSGTITVSKATTNQVYTLVITDQNDGESVEVSFVFNVAVDEIASIVVANAETQYTAGDEFDDSMTVYATYDSGETRELESTEYKIVGAPEGEMARGTYTIIVKLVEDESIYDSFDITVAKPEGLVILVESTSTVEDPDHPSAGTVMSDAAGEWVSLSSSRISASSHWDLSAKLSEPVSTISITFNGQSSTTSNAGAVYTFKIDLMKDNEVVDTIEFDPYTVQKAYGDGTVFTANITGLSYSDGINNFKFYVGNKNTDSGNGNITFKDFAITYSGFVPGSKTVTIFNGNALTDAIYDFIYSIYDENTDTWKINLSNWSSITSSPEYLALSGADKNLLKVGVVSGYDEVAEETKESCALFAGFIEKYENDVTANGLDDFLSRGFKVHWKDSDGNTVAQDSSCFKGQTPVYTGSIPYKAEDASNSYVFSGWDKEFGPITGETTYIAQFDSYEKGEAIRIDSSNYHDGIYEFDIITANTSLKTGVDVEGIDENGKVSANTEVVMTLDNPDMKFIEAEMLLVNGKVAKVWYSTDGGETWIEVKKSRAITPNPEIPEDANGVKFVINEDDDVKALLLAAAPKDMELSHTGYIEYDWEVQGQETTITNAKTGIEFEFEYRDERLSQYQDSEEYTVMFIYNSGSDEMSFEELWDSSYKTAVVTDEMIISNNASLVIRFGNSGDLNAKWAKVYSVAIVVIDSDGNLVDYSDVICTSFNANKDSLKNLGLEHIEDALKYFGIIE